MRWPERTRKKWRLVAYGLELTALVAQYAGIAIFIILTLYQLQGLLQSGQWPWLAMKLFFVHVVPTGFFTDPSSWYVNPSAWKGAQTALWIFMERIPVSLLFLAIGKCVALFFYWIVDKWFTAKDVALQRSPFAQFGSFNIK